MIIINKIYILLIIWVGALIAPSVISILGRDSSAVVSIMSEEENQEHEIESLGELVNFTSINFYVIFHGLEQKDLAYLNNFFIHHSQNFAKIMFPPPDLTL
jgi:hypothetical protein